MDFGLDYLKYSFESTDDVKFKEVRGNAANFSEAYKKTVEVLSIKEKRGFNTTIIITMIDIGHNEEQREEYRKLREVFEGLDVYIYLKSEDQQWYRKDETLKEYLEDRDRTLPDQEQAFYGTESIHWAEFCKHPWMSRVLNLMVRFICVWKIITMKYFSAILIKRVYMIFGMEIYMISLDEIILN